MNRQNKRGSRIVVLINDVLAIEKRKDRWEGKGYTLSMSLGSEKRDREVSSNTGVGGRPDEGGSISPKRQKKKKKSNLKRGN